MSGLGFASLAGLDSVDEGAPASPFCISASSESWGTRKALVGPRSTTDLTGGASAVKATRQKDAHIAFLKSGKPARPTCPWGEDAWGKNSKGGDVARSLRAAAPAAAPSAPFAVNGPSAAPERSAAPPAVQPPAESVQAEFYANQRRSQGRPLWDDSVHTQPQLPPTVAASMDAPFAPFATHHDAPPPPPQSEVVAAGSPFKEYYANKTKFEATKPLWSDATLPALPPSAKANLDVPFAPYAEHHEAPQVRGAAAESAEVDYLANKAKFEATVPLWADAPVTQHSSPSKVRAGLDVKLAGATANAAATAEGYNDYVANKVKFQATHSLW